MEYLHENQYFTCSCGLKPAKMSSTQAVIVFEKKYYFLTKQSTASSHIGDFMCRWTVVLAGLVIGLGVVTGGAALLVFGAAVLASGLMCGALFAGARKWICEKDDANSGDIRMLTARAIMVCPVGGQVTVAPGIDSWWKAAIYTARNVGWAFLEGFFLGKMAGAGGKALFGASNIATVSQFATNFVFLQASARGIAATDQVFIEGMLRNGLDFDNAVKEHGVDGLMMFEQPFINIYKKLNGEVKYPDGTEQSLNWTDFYGAGLSALGTVAMAKASASHPNLPKATYNQLKNSINKLRGKNGKMYEVQELFDPTKDSRYEELSTERGKQTNKNRNEAEAALQAEHEGKIENPRRPDPKKGEPDLDFKIDGPKPNKYVDIKTPVDPKYRPLETQAADISKNIKSQKAGSSDVLHIVDLKNLPPEAKPAFKKNVIDGVGHTDGIIFINE